MRHRCRRFCPRQIHLLGTEYDDEKPGLPSPLRELAQGRHFVVKNCHTHTGYYSKDQRLIELELGRH